LGGGGGGRTNIEAERSEAQPFKGMKRRRTANKGKRRRRRGDCKKEG
jgi:hypothetical protein